MIASGFSSMSHTTTCFWTPICGAASAIPLPESTSVSNIASTSRMTLPSTSSTREAWVFNTGSPYVLIVNDIHVRLEAVSSEQYFDDDPTVPSAPLLVDVTLPDTAFVLETDRGVFSHGHLDTATSMLLRADLPIASTGDLLDLGCGAGPIALTMARRSPAATVWAVDVNARARELCARNAARNALSNIRVVAPADVPPDVRFVTIWSNPPIRIGKAALHELLKSWLGRLTDAGSASLVVQRHLGADSLQRWLIELGYDCERVGSKAGYRLFTVRRR